MSRGRRYARAGRTLLLIGHAGHAEVEGTIGQIDAPVHLVSTAEDVATLTLDPQTPIAYVTQTTLSVDDTRGVIAAIHAHFSDVVGPDVADICYATQNRQTAVRELARLSDLLIVVGARNSSNSSRLKEIGLEMGLPSYLVDDGTGIDPAWLDGVETVGITAGRLGARFAGRQCHRHARRAPPGHGEPTRRRPRGHRIQPADRAAAPGAPCAAAE